MRVHRKVISRDSGNWLLCCWDDCERFGYEIHHVTINDAKPGYPPKLVKFVFCSERHRQYWLDELPVDKGPNRTGLHGTLATGNKSLPL